VAEKGISLMSIDVVAEAECVRYTCDQVRESIAALVQWQQPEIGPIELQEIECNQVSRLAGFWEAERMEIGAAIHAQADCLAVEDECGR
jgi:hypothetical protein